MVKSALQKWIKKSCENGQFHFFSFLLWSNYSWRFNNHKNNFNPHHLKVFAMENVIFSILFVAIVSGGRISKGKFEFLQIIFEIKTILWSWYQLHPDLYFKYRKWKIDVPNYHIKKYRRATVHSCDVWQWGRGWLRVDTLQTKWRIWHWV